LPTQPQLGVREFLRGPGCKTLMFNGSADQMASLYAGMDLDVQF
jgi:hypothetical protein